MRKLKVAVLEDSKPLLKDLIQDLGDTKLVEVIAYATDSDSFLEKVQQTKPDALLLDIDLAGESMNGLDIANKLALPVLFLSGKTKDYFERMEELNINSHLPIEHITKPITLDKLNKILPKFIASVQTVLQKKEITLSFLGGEKSKIELAHIVYISAEKEHGSASQNKRVHFTNRKPETLVDIAFKDLVEKGLQKDTFITIHRAFLVNVNHIQEYNRKDNLISIEYFSAQGQMQQEWLPVSENYRINIPKELK